MTVEDERLRLDGAAFCIAHRLRYDPQLNVGCVLCQRAFSLRAAAPSARGGLGSPVALGVLVGLCGALAFELAPLLLNPPQRSSTRPVSGSLRGHGAGPGSARPATVMLQPSNPALDEREPPLPEGAPRSGLHGAAARGDVAAIQQALDTHADIDGLDSQGLTPLLWALRASRPEAARVLIERGARVDLATPSSPAPLLLAAAKGLEATTELLLARGAKSAAVDDAGASALLLAARHGHLGVVRSLLARGAVIGQSDGMGRSALLHAAQNGASPEMLALLLDRGARLEARDIEGASALLLAAEQGNEQCVRALLARGADLGARDQRGWSGRDPGGEPRPGAREAPRAGGGATLAQLVEHGIEPRLAIDPASNQVLFRAELERLYARRGLGALPAYRPFETRVAVSQGGRPVARPATLQLLAAIRTSYQAGELASGTLVGYRGWTFVPSRLTRCVLRNVALYGEQRATLVAEADGGGTVHVADVILFEQLEGGRVKERAFAGRPDGIEVDGAPVRRIGARSRDLAPGSLDVTSLLSHDGSDLAISVLSGYGSGHVSNVYLRIDGPDAQRTIARAEVERDSGGGAP